MNEEPLAMPVESPQVKLALRDKLGLLTPSEIRPYSTSTPTGKMCLGPKALLIPQNMAAVCPESQTPANKPTATRKVKLGLFSPSASSHSFNKLQSKGILEATTKNLCALRLSPTLEPPHHVKNEENVNSDCSLTCVDEDILIIEEKVSTGDVEYIGDEEVQVLSVIRKEPPTVDLVNDC